VTYIEERDGDRVRRGRKYTYTPSWTAALTCPNSNDFNDKTKVNIQPNLEAEKFYCAQFNCGRSFTLDPKMLLERSNLESEPSKIGPEFYPVSDNQGDWV
jgi:hypothetical protein